MNSFNRLWKKVFKEFRKYNFCLEFVGYFRLYKKSQYWKSTSESNERYPVKYEQAARYHPFAAYLSADCDTFNHSILLMHCLEGSV